MWSYLISSVELFSNQKSFSLGVDTTRNLWLLLHFKDLEIKHKTLLYQVDNGIRQRKSTKHPVRKMVKKHTTTAELLRYLSDKPYKIIHLELEFTNGWKIKQMPYIALWFYNNSTEERDKLITRLLSISGQGPIDISKLEENHTYSFISHDTLVKVDPEGLPLPDEFWSEERVNNWKKEYDKIYNSSSIDDSESVPF
ncbi:MAG: hypothetical protein L7U78_00545 [Schleiferiaceae bacterium]|nr:hypothetical protein [Schleiferiaceae bacterium]